MLQILGIAGGCGVPYEALCSSMTAHMSQILVTNIVHVNKWHLQTSCPYLRAMLQARASGSTSPVRPLSFCGHAAPRRLPQALSAAARTPAVPICDWDRPYMADRCYTWIHLCYLK
jgi:hypothetical protein